MDLHILPLLQTQQVVHHLVKVVTTMTAIVKKHFKDLNNQFSERVSVNFFQNVQKVMFLGGNMEC